MQEWISNLISDAIAIYGTIGPVDIIDILVVALAVYGLIVVVRDTNTNQVIKAILVLFLANIAANEIGLKTFGYLLNEVLNFGIIALFVLFQPEIRRGLDKMGRARVLNSNLFDKTVMEESMRKKWRVTITAICDAAQQLSDKHTGALIVVERSMRLYDYSRNGTRVNADVTPELLMNIFFNGSPLHDGAVIIGNAKLISAGCVMPLSSNHDMSKDLGTRHRAALGTAELTDAIVVVISEETGVVSVAKNGILIRRVDRAGIYRILEEELIPENTESTKRRSLLSNLFSNLKRKNSEPATNIDSVEEKNAEEKE